MVKAANRNKMTTRLFAGFELTPDIRLLLSKSNEWKQAHVAAQDTIIECPFQDKIYIGRYLQSSILTTIELKITVKAIRQLIESYCPELDTESLPFYFFPIVLVA